MVLEEVVEGAEGVLKEVVEGVSGEVVEEVEVVYYCCPPHKPCLMSFGKITSSKPAIQS